MDKKKIQGIYDLYANITACFPTYNLTGNNRNANYKTTASRFINFDMLNGTTGQAVHFKLQNTQLIKRGRIVTPGCEGLRAGLNSIAMDLFLEPYDYDNNITDPDIFCHLQFLKFNEWQNFDIRFDAFKSTKLISDKFDFVFEPIVSGYNIDDFNIQADYIGQPVSFGLELEIDTSGIFDFNGDLI